MDTAEYYLKQAEFRASLIGDRFPVGDAGHVHLIDVMGSDRDICDAARLSYGKGTKTISDDRTLIRYLMRHKHTSPFEMAELKFGIKVPMDAWRQWIRHRTANVNEYSTRYSEAIDDTARTEPDKWRLQSKSNKQGSGGFIGVHDEFPPELDDRRPENCGGAGEYLSGREIELHLFAREVYQERLEFGVAREQARKDLPLSTYTEAYWKVDLHNLLHFLRLRMDPHAQIEIRSYADVIGHEIVSRLFPLTWEAFEDYTLDALTLSAPEISVIMGILEGQAPEEMISIHLDNVREASECREKLRILGHLPRDKAAE